MKFLVTDRFGTFTSPPNEPLIILRKDNWDDFGYKTLFYAEMMQPGHSEPTELGQVKILRAGQESGQTPFDAEYFDALDSRYCSLGQDIEYYERLASLNSHVRSTLLTSLRDAATDPEIASQFSTEDGWTTSLLRFGQAEHSLEAAAALFGGTTLPAGMASFTHVSADLGTSIDFVFDDSGLLPGRCQVLIGYNGVGKTRLLAEIARDTSKVGLDPEPTSVRSNNTFGAVLAVSYSAFDRFELPPVVARPSVRDSSLSGDASTTTHFGYTYCGLRRLHDGQVSSQLKSIDELDKELVHAFRLACSKNSPALRQALGDIELDPSFGRTGLKLSDWVQMGEVPMHQLEMFSSGQKIVINIIAQLAAHLRNRSLVLIDEPETHLHPPLLAALLRGIQRLLDHFDSFAIIATHSPVVLQEVPSKDVQVIERFGDSVQAVRPQLETFGSGLGELTHEAFGLDNSVSDYRSVIRALAQQMNIDTLEGLFPLGLSSQARALAIRAQVERS